MAFVLAAPPARAQAASFAPGGAKTCAEPCRASGGLGRRRQRAPTALGSAASHLWAAGRRFSGRAACVSSPALARPAFQPRAEAERDPPMPSTLDEAILAAKRALRRDLDAGATRLLIDIPLPLIGKTDLDDWPGGIGQQFIALGPIQKKLASVLSDDAPEEEGYLDKADSVYVWNYGTKGVLVSFASSETLKKFKKYVDEKCSDRPVIVINRMWKPEDFGWGGAKQEALAFTGSFVPCYAFRTFQVKTGITTAVQGAQQYTSVAKWQVFRVSDDGRGEQLASGLPERPIGRELDALFKGDGGGGGGGGGLFGGLFGR